jgi:hypothetical protein
MYEKNHLQFRLSFDNEEKLGLLRKSTPLFPTGFLAKFNSFKLGHASGVFSIATKVRAPSLHTAQPAQEPIMFNT